MIGFGITASAQDNEKAEFKFNEEDSEEHLAINFHDFKLNFKDFIFLIIITDC